MASAGKIGLDTNMLMAITEFRIDIFEEIRTMLGNVEFVAPQQVIRELENLGTQDRTMEKRCRIAKELMSKNNVKTVEVNARGADNALLELSQEMAIATNDKALKKRIKDNGGKVLILRQKKHIEFA